MIRVLVLTLALLVALSGTALAHGRAYCGHGSHAHGDRRVVHTGSMNVPGQGDVVHRHLYRESRRVMWIWVPVSLYWRSCPTH